MNGYLRYPPARQIMAPGSLWNLDVPEARVEDPYRTTALRNEIAAVNGTSRYGYINTTNAGLEIYVRSVNDPREPVEYMRADFNGVLPTWAKPRQAMMTQFGVPVIGDDYIPDPSSDGVLIVYLPDWHWEGIVSGVPTELDGLLIEFWRFLPRDPSDGGPRWTAQEMGYFHGVEQGLSGYRKRFTAVAMGADGLPKDANNKLAYEQDNMGPSISRNPMLPGAITVEDVERGEIDHAVRFLLSDYKRSSFVWPAHATDGGSSTSQIPNGTFAYLPSDYVIPDTLHPVARMLARAVQKKGAYISDRTHGPTAWQAEPGVLEHFGDTPPYLVLKGFPYYALRVGVPGSDSNPHPI